MFASTLCADDKASVWHRGRREYEKREAARNDLIVFISRGRARKYLLCRRLASGRVGLCDTAFDLAYTLRYYYERYLGKFVARETLSF